MSDGINTLAVLKVGNVKSVKGRKIEVLIDKSKNSSNLLFNGDIIKNVSVGSYVKICKGFEVLIGKIDGEYVSEDLAVNNKKYKKESDRNKRILDISLLGYFERKQFKQGVKELPLIDNECFLLTKDEFDSVHKFIKIINGTPDIPIILGALASERGKKIEVGINSLFASHIGIFGNTGSGKSYTLASLYHKLFEKYIGRTGFKENSRFLFIDFNGEYSTDKAIIEPKRIYHLSTSERIEEIDVVNRLPISEKVILNSDLLAILSSATDKTQKPFLSRVIKQYNSINKAEDPKQYFRNHLGYVLKNVLGMASKEKAFSLIEHIEEIINYGKGIQAQVHLKSDVDFQNKYEYFKLKTSNVPIENDDIERTNLFQAAMIYEFPSVFIDKLLHFFSLTLIYDLYDDRAQFEHIGPAINKLKSNANSLQKVINFDVENSDLFDNSNIVVVDLNDCNIEIKKLIPLILAKNEYDLHKKKSRKNSNRDYLNIVIDEAHNILSQNSERESTSWKDYRLETFEEIIKEGRKFGVFLTIASQRPSDISDTIISQLHNYFLHRLINNRDIQAVERTISYLDKVSFESLPIMPTGTCVFAGLCAHVPVIIEVDKIEEGFEPHNETIKPTDYWN